MIRWSVLLFALLMSAPAVYRFVLDEIDLTEMLVRFLIAVPIAAILLAGLRFVTAGYGRTDEPGISVKPQPAPDAGAPDPDPPPA